MGNSEENKAPVRRFCSVGFRLLEHWGEVDSLTQMQQLGVVSTLGAT